jgi:hypothetical protein|tara:strand:+ start:94 stop:648 length:555 start_codon:yes stop_codon:yes gene_type:complete
VKKIILINLLFLLICNNSFSKIIFLKCTLSEKYKFHTNYYIDTEKENVGHYYIDMNNQQFIVYDWFYLYPEFSEEFVSFGNPRSFFGYRPENALLNRIFINRKTLRAGYKSKADKVESYISKFSYIPRNIVEIVARNLVDWEYETYLTPCTIVKTPQNIKFINKSEWKKLLLQEEEKYEKKKLF